ncbi:MAG: DUF4364 family protein [Lachnospiraceae bacterium]|nr:DUF4364 family protein [Lachnospiraceae bacterium]
MILYLLKNVSFSLNHENLSNFFLDKYTSFISFQEILADLVDTKLVEEYKTKTSIFYKATSDGVDALDSFIDEITKAHREELDKYIKDNKFKLKEESIIRANYTDSTDNNFKIVLEINENKDENFKIEMDVPTSDAAITMCENWKEKAKNIYTYVIKQLL